MLTSTCAQHIDKNKGLYMFILAGYEKQMKTSFLQNNDGLDRRFPNRYVFPSYTPSQLVEILVKMCTKSGIIGLWEQDTFNRLQVLITNAKAVHDLHMSRHGGNENASKKDTDTAAYFIWEELFSKQAGSIELLAAKMLDYTNIPEKKPARWGRPYYNYAQDMIAVLATRLDSTWFDDLQDPSSLVRRALADPLRY